MDWPGPGIHGKVWSGDKQLRKHFEADYVPHDYGATRAGSDHVNIHHGTWDEMSRVIGRRRSAGGPLNMDYRPDKRFKPAEGMSNTSTNLVRALDHDVRHHAMLGAQRLQIAGSEHSLDDVLTAQNLGWDEAVRSHPFASAGKPALRNMERLLSGGQFQSTGSGLSAPAGPPPLPDHAPDWLRGLDAEHHKDFWRPDTGWFGF